MVTPDEKLILKFIQEEKGESTVVHVAREMGFRIDYTKSILESMGRRDIVDLFVSGKVRLASRAWKALGVPPDEGMFSKYEVGRRPDETREEKYRRWMGIERAEEVKAEEEI